MSLRTETMRSLERLRAIQKPVASRVRKNSPRWRQIFSKKDYQFLLAIFITLSSLATLVILIVNDSPSEAVDKKHQQEISNQIKNGIEISLGEFEAAKEVQGKPGMLTILGYETAFSAQGSLANMSQTRKQVEQRKNRFRSVIEMVVNNSTKKEREEPDLKTIRATAVTRVNQVLNKGEITDVFFPRFSSFEMKGSL